MIKKEIYPKTKRISCSERVDVTEKLDGSNLCIFKKEGLLWVAQRRTIVCESEFNNGELTMYKGLRTWLNEHKEELNKLREGSVICGEWLGMGCLKYNKEDGFNKRFYMFAKANIDSEFNLYNIYYDHDLFLYPFEDEEFPECIDVVPVVDTLSCVPGIQQLNDLYQEYSNEVQRPVEGFVVNYNNNIQKYVRIKNGKLSPHFDRGE